MLVEDGRTAMVGELPRAGTLRAVMRLDQLRYPIGMVAELLELHPETMRVWERHGLLQPQRRGQRRCYSDADLQRLSFIKYLTRERGINVAGVCAYIALYPCWKRDLCMPQNNVDARPEGTKPCWKRLGSYCGLAREEAARCEQCFSRSKGIKNQQAGKVVPA